MPSEKIAGKAFNAGYQNQKIADIASIVQKVMKEELPERGEIEIETTPSDDIRSYRISSEKIKNEIGFIPQYSIEDAVRDLIKAFQGGKFENSLDNTRYFNIKTLKADIQCNVS